MHNKLLASNILECNTILFIKTNSEICKTLYTNIVKNLLHFHLKLHLLVYR